MIEAVSVAGFCIGGLGFVMFIVGLNDKFVTRRWMLKLLSMNRYASDDERQRFDVELVRSTGRLMSVSVWLMLLGFGLGMSAYLTYVILH